MESKHQRRYPQDIRKRTFDFACRIVKLHQYLYQKGGTERAIGTQVLRSGTSIGANLEEANAGQTKRDFIAKCSISLKEARETYFWLRLLVTTDILPDALLKPLLTETNEIISILTTIVKSAKQHNDG
jgi:four helix bundle protein